MVLTCVHLQFGVIVDGVNKRFSTIGGRWGYDDFVPEEVTKTAPSGDEIT